LHPALVGVVLKLAQRFGIRGVRAAAAVGRRANVRSALLSLVARSAARRFRAGGLRTPDAFRGLAETGVLDAAALLPLRARLPGGDTHVILALSGADGERLLDARGDRRVALDAMPRAVEVVPAGGSVRLVPETVVRVHGITVGRALPTGPGRWLLLALAVAAL